jgi:hypothetical protein
MRHKDIYPTQREGCMMDEVLSKKSRSEEFLDELQREVSDPLHRRLIQAYRGDNPVQSMESELAKILFEVLRGED